MTETEALARIAALIADFHPDDARPLVQDLRAILADVTPSPPPAIDRVERNGDFQTIHFTNGTSVWTSSEMDETGEWRDGRGIDTVLALARSTEPPQTIDRDALRVSLDTDRGDAPDEITRLKEQLAEAEYAHESSEREVADLEQRLDAMIGKWQEAQARLDRIRGLPVHRLSPTALGWVSAEALQPILDDPQPTPPQTIDRAALLAVLRDCFPWAHPDGRVIHDAADRILALLAPADGMLLVPAGVAADLVGQVLDSVGWEQQTQATRAFIEDNFMPRPARLETDPVNAKKET